jgi:D-alanine-D-alanine ligase
VLPGVNIDRADWDQHREAELDRLESALAYPMYIKPANLGSSIGISRADNRQTLADSIDIAAEYDRRIIVEKGVVEVKEVNCSVLGFGNDVTASVLEMPIRWDDKEILDFASKYLSGEGGKGMETQSRRIPAPISDDLTAKIRALSVEVFKSLDCKGVVRIDYIIDESDGSYYICEINTIPGSLSYYLWNETDLTFPELLTKLVDFSIKAQREKLRNNLSFESAILENVGKGSKGNKHGV